MYQYTDSQLPDLLEMECSDMELKNRTLSNFAELVRTGECKKFRGRLKVGVDLGTANTVLAVVDSTNRPIAGVSAPSHAIRDGVIVNYYESVQLVTKLKEEKLISAIEVETVDAKAEEKLPGIVGLILTGSSDLWEIAKKYHTTVSAIRKTNELDEEMEINGRKILVVKEVPDIG